MDYRESLTLLNAFTLVATEGLPLAKDKMAFDQRVRDIVFEQLSGKTKSKTQDKRKVKTHLRIGKQIALAHRSVDAAKVIFAHTVLDSLTISICKVVIYADPLSWFNGIESDTSVKNILAAKKDRNKIVWRFLDEQVLALGRKNLPNRIKLIEQNCRPCCSKSFIANVPDAHALKKLDKLRHEIIHENWLNKNETVLIDPTLILSDQTTYLFHLVSSAFNFNGLSMNARLQIAVAKVRQEKDARAG